MPQTPDRDAVRFLVASTHCEVAGLQDLIAAGRLVVGVRGLVHCLQRERGASNLFLGSAGRCYGEQLGAYQADAAQAETRLREELAGWLSPPQVPRDCSRLFARIAMLLQGLTELPHLRAQVHAGAGGVDATMSSFNELIRGLLGVVFEAADSAADPQISRALVAMFNFMQGKELAGQERAIGAAGFSRGEFDERLQQSLLHRIDGQERCFQTFTEFCDSESLALWQHTLTAAHSTEVERLRRISCTQTKPRSPGIELAEIWFTQTTSRIDAMKEVEDGLEAYLLGLCQSRIATVTAEQASAEDRIAELARSELAHDTPFAVVLGQSEAPPDADVQAPRRSVMDLVQRQSRRLQAMEDELQAARQALNERKVIERAKALLMKHRDLSEDQAHRLLRQTAMNQNRRLVEVAEATVAMADVLGS